MVSRRTAGDTAGRCDGRQIKDRGEKGEERRLKRGIGKGDAWPCQVCGSEVN